MRSAVRCYAPPVPALSPHAVKQSLVVRSLIVSFRLIYPTFVASCAFLCSHVYYTRCTPPESLSYLRGSCYQWIYNLVRTVMNWRVRSHKSLLLQSR